MPPRIWEAVSYEDLANMFWSIGGNARCSYILMKTGKRA